LGIRVKVRGIQIEMVMQGQERLSWFQGVDFRVDLRVDLRGKKTLQKTKQTKHFD